MMKIKVGIIGGAGYTGGELTRILLNHPLVEIDFIHSKSNAGKFVYTIHDDLLGETNLLFTNEIREDVDLIFLCVSHGEAKAIVSKIKSLVKIIDLSQDHRINGTHSFVYGLSEWNREQIKTARYIANPGCFATAIQLALLPLAAANLLNDDIVISCTTGSTGAGQSLSKTSHYSWRNDNLSVYKAFTHQHLLEIKQSIQIHQEKKLPKINIFPQRGAFSRGILCCISTKTTKSIEEIKNLFLEKYQHEVFVKISPSNCHLKQVTNTNKCLIYFEKNGDELMIISVIDNLIKGASGQAIQNMNLMFGFDETTGLKLKASAF